MISFGTLDNQYHLLYLKHETKTRQFYVARHDQTLINYIIEIRKIQDDNNNGNNVYDIFPINEVNILNILNNTNNPYILKYIGNGYGQLTLNLQNPITEYYIVYEDAPKPSLFEYLLVEGFSERHSKLLFKKILKGIQAIHNANICHRGINLTNILFDENYNPKIFDFQISCLNANNLTENVGYFGYKPPEVILNKPYNGFKYDIFSLGQLMFNLVTGKNIFKDSEIEDKNYILKGKHMYDQFWKCHLYSQNFQNLFNRMISDNPNERPTIDEILNDTWMQEINNLTTEQLNNLELEIIEAFHERENLVLDQRKQKKINLLNI